MLLKWLFDISPQETSFARRGFRGDNPAARARLEQVGAAFVLGYRAALTDAQPDSLAPILDGADLVFRGFAYEGAAMALALRDWFTPWKRERVTNLLRGAGDAHTYMVHVGAGWVLARVPGRVNSVLARFDPLLRWLLIDGYGFHEGFFHWPKYLSAGRPAPARLQGYARRVFDQGLGRCLWFIDGTDVTLIPRTIAALAPERHADLWSGVGLAAVYAGEVTAAELESLRAAAGSFQPQLAQGAAFAAKARQRADNSTLYQDLACGVLCGVSAREAAHITDAALENLPANDVEPAYEIWRQRIQKEFSRGRELKR